MSTKGFVIDGLWHCLCPSFRTAGLNPSRVFLGGTKYIRAAKPILECQPQTYTTSASTVHAPFRRILGPLAVEKSVDHATAEKLQQLDLRDVLSARNKAKQKPDRQRERWHAFLAKRQKKKEEHLLKPDSLSALPVENVYARLEDAAKRGRLDFVKSLIGHLIEARGEVPALRHYHALIRANVHAQMGSASAVKLLLDEMKAKNIMADSTLYRCALRTLAVHPDYLLQTRILEEMRMRWFNLTDSAYHDLVAGLIRSRHFELAIDRIEEMQDQKVPIEPWLYDLMIYGLLAVNEVNEAARILRYREKHEDDGQISPNVWYQLLETASRNLEYEAVIYVWRRRVEIFQLSPPDGMCQCVLDTAARHGDPQLATHVLNILGARGLIFKLHHYEALLEAYVASGDISSALGVLNVMNRNNVIPETGSTRPLFFALQANREAIRDAWNALEVFSDTQKVSIAGINVVMEAAAHLQDTEDVQKFYKALPKIGQPDLRTFHILFLHAVQNTDTILAEKLFSDMQTADIVPDTLIIDRLLLVYVRKGALSKAKEVWEREVGGSFGGWRLGTFWSVVRLAASRRDPWALKALEGMRLAFPNEMALDGVENWLNMVMQGVEEVEEPRIEVEL